MNLRPFAVALLGLALTACASQVNAPPSAPVPTSVTLEGTSLTLETYLNRDFMPFSPADGRPLTAFVRVRSTNGAPVPSGLAVSKVSVYFHGQIWSSAPEAMAPYDPLLLEAVARDGPLWGPGDLADVVVTLSIAGHPRAELLAREQPIHRSD